MKRILVAIFVLAMVGILLVGCLSDPTGVTVVVKNSTEYDLETIIFEIPQNRGTYSPMHDVVASDDAPLKPGEEREVTIWAYESDLGNTNTSYPIIFIAGDSETRHGRENGIVLNRGVNSFEITCDNNMKFIVKSVSNE